MARAPLPVDVEPPPDWHKNRKLVRDGLHDLAYLPAKSRRWNATLAAVAFAVRRRLAGRADLGLWAVMHGLPASARAVELGDDALVLWHGTSAARAEKIRDHGLFTKRGLWTTRDPSIAHGYTRGRSRTFKAGSAMIVLLLDDREVAPGRHYDPEGDEILRFYKAMPPECVEYILWDDRIELLGGRRAEGQRPWGRARFTRRGGRWSPRSRPPVRFDDADSYDNLDEWLELSIRRILATLGRAAAVEVFSSLYATIDPWEALEHDQIMAALDAVSGGSSSRRKFRTFSLPLARQ